MDCVRWWQLIDFEPPPLWIVHWNVFLRLLLLCSHLVYLVLLSGVNLVSLLQGRWVELILPKILIVDKVF